MANVEATIQRIAKNFVQDIVKALVGSSISEFAQIANKGGSRRAPAPVKAARPGRPPKVDKTEKAEKSGARGKKSGGKRNRRSSLEIDGIKENVINFVRDNGNPEGVSVSEIAKAIRENIGDITRPIHQAVASGHIKKKGEKRLTRYFPGKKD